MVVEADESDGTFLKLPADIAVVTNINPEHLDRFGTFDAIQETFRAFVENIPFYGFAVMCAEPSGRARVASKIEDRRVITYGRDPDADVRPGELDLRNGVFRFTAIIRDRDSGTETPCLKTSSCSMPDARRTR